MAISLEELKRQREQIRKHLAWLDAKIEDLAPESKTPDSEKPATTPETAATAQPEGTPLVQPTPAPEGYDTPEAEDQSNAEALPSEIDGSTYQAKTQSELARAKIGCVVFFILGIALFLFLLFGLPYLL